MILLRPSRVGVCLTLAYALAMLVVDGGSSKDAVSSDEIRDIEKFAGDVMGCANIPGLAVGIVRGDATFSTGLGVTNMATGFPADKRTLFNLGSTSKALVPYILAEIMNGKENLDGRISWTSTIKEILSPQSETEVPLPWAEISLKDMLVYKSGSSAADLTTMVGVADQVTREEVVRRLRFLSNTTEFHNSNHHSNIMYTVAGHLAERLSGMSWPELVKFKVLDKLKMNMTLLAPEGMSVEDAALPYRFHSSKPRDPFQEQVGSLFNLGPFSPAGSLMTSAEDVTKWLRHLVYNLHAEGNNSGVNMLIRDAFHKWVTVPGSHREGEISHDSEVALGYGMGWYSSTYRGQRRLKFSGGMYAYNSQIWLFPDTLSAIFVSINGPGNERATRALEGIMYHISDITLRKPAWVDDKTACCCHESDYDNDDHRDDVAPAEQKLVRYKAPVEKYIGTYGHGLVGDIRIEPNEAGVLILKLGRNLVGELTPGVTESKLRFTVTSSLVNTEEWSSEKTLEFLLSTATTAGVSSSELYDKVRIYITDHLFYEFHRGSLFESLLTTAEENDKKQREESDGFVHKGEVQHNQSTTTEAENDDSDAVKDEADTQERNRSSFKPHKGGDTQKSSLHENGIKPSIPNSDKETDRKTNSEGHQNHQPYSSEGHSSEGHSDDADLEEKNKKDSELDRKTDKNKSALGSDSACSILQTFSIVTLLMIVLSIISN